MLSILKNRTYRHLFAAQLIAVMGTGLATIALALLAYDLAGDRAGLVLGTALTIKMLSYVTIAPIASALAEGLPRRAWLVSLDVIRAAVALALPFVDQIWQIYVLIFLLQASSAAFTPAFQASIPDVLPDEEDYTNALSLSRLAYDLESLLSPALAAALLTVMAFGTMFFGTALGFIASALLVLSITLPSPKPTRRRGIYDRTTRGVRLYLKTPRLRGLLGLSMVASATGAMVIVNTVVLVRGELGLNENMVAWALASFGAGSMLAALTLPRVLSLASDRRIMSAGALISLAALALLAVQVQLAGLSLAGLLVAWLGIGIGYSTILTPSGRLLRRSAQAEDRPAIFAAQFTLSHGCWLVTYPLSGWLLSQYGTGPALWGLTALGLAGLLYALRQWPAQEPSTDPGDPSAASRN
ncbi:MFS transporter [Parasedimentitalea psychrophila]|uniref:MFS transporter n=1 Tax=Parasedimentitalea psychrophila TaxID=2997337 RepID=A0A9Y2P904_9RHOB|nr:MFS transporter [Parasedimentitalea psychrophila]WIY27465.1 MFS transporter [Parasedimentitalea psychrophila]